MTTVPDPRARDLVGIPFATGGRDFRPVEGRTDCLGVVREFLRRTGVDATDPWENLELRLRWRGEDSDVRDDFPPGWRPVDLELEELVVGDVASTNGGRHVAVHIGGGLALHATHKLGTRISPIRSLVVDGWWRFDL